MRPCTWKNYEISKLTRISRSTTTMIWIFSFVVFTLCVSPSNSLEGYYQPPRGSSVWGYFTPPLLYRAPTRTYQTAMDAMVDLTNNLGVTILKDHSYSKANFAFSPYGVASVLVVLYEGACGESANQIHRAIGFPFDKDVIRVGFRSIHRHLRSYFSHEGYLSGISLNKEGSALKPEFKRILKFYGYDVDVNHPVDEDVSLEDLNSPLRPSGGAIANSNVTSSTPSGVTEDDNQSTNHSNATKGSDGGKETSKDVTTETSKKTTEKPESTTKDENDSSKKKKPGETGDVDSNDRETEKPNKPPKDDFSVEGSKENPDKIDSGEGDNESPEKATGDENDSSEIEVDKTADPEKVRNDKVRTKNSDKTSSEDISAVEEDKENSALVEDGSSSSGTEEKGNEDTSDTNETVNSNETSIQGDEDTSEGSSDTEEKDDTSETKETENSDESSIHGSDTADEDKQNSEGGSESIEKPQDTAFGQDDDKEMENPNETPEEVNTSQYDKENSDSSTEGHSQDSKRVSEEVCKGDCENKTEDSTTTTTGKQEPEEMSITTLSDGLILNKTEPTEEVEDLQVTSSTIKNSDESSENGETGVPTEETKSEVSTSEYLESPLTTTLNPSQEEEVTKTTESSVSETTTTQPSLDNGMLIPQPDDPPTNSESPTTEVEGGLESTTTDTTAESKKSTTDEGAPGEVTTSEPYARRKRDTSTRGLLRVSNRYRPLNKISVWGQMKLAGVEPSRQTRQAFHPKLSALYGMRNRRTITDYLKWPQASDVSLQLQNGMFDSHVSRNLELYKSLPRLMFLVDGAIDMPVPMMTYTHVFPYAYIPRLHTKALEFPLDDVRYKLLILLPVERRGLRQLIYDLTEFPLREVFTSLQPTRVRAMIPPFMVEGFVILTSSLQKLGIQDVFDPRKSNLSGMSIDPELYVRNVEQSVTVVIRNYVEILDIQTRTMAARNMEHDFEATHPFLYFVLDTATNVALMAGQILDPLNSRIY